MELEVATVFVNFQVFAPLPASKKESRTPYDLIDVARTLWNSEVVRNSRGELLHCVVRFPPLTYKGVLYAGPVLTVRPGGVAELVSSGSVDAALTFTLYARALLLDATRRSPLPQAVRTHSGRTERSPLLAQCLDSPESKGLLTSLSEQRYLEEQRLLAAVRGERTDADLFTHTAALLTSSQTKRDRVPPEATVPSVSFFNAILRADVYEIMRLQKKLGFRDPFYCFVAPGPRREPRISLNVTGDATVEWLHHFLCPIAVAATAVTGSAARADKEVLSAEERAYVAPKQAELARVLTSFSAQRFERQTGIQLVLHFSTHKTQEAGRAVDHRRLRDDADELSGRGGTAKAEKHKTRKTEDAPLSGADMRAPSPSVLPTAPPNLSSVDVFFAESVLPPAPQFDSPPRRTRTPANTRAVDSSPSSPPLSDGVSAPPPLAAPVWEETIKCSLFSTGNAQVTAKSEKGLEVAARLVLLPLLVCRAHIG